MARLILLHGLLAGLVVGGLNCGIVVAFRGHLMGGLGMAVGYLIMLVALSAVFVGVKRYRDVERGGVIRFWPAFGMGLGISAVAGIIYVVAWDIALALSGFDFMAEYTRLTLETMRRDGAEEAEIARTAAEMRAFAVQYQNPLIRWPLTFSELLPVGLLVSLVSAGLLRNPRFLPASQGTVPA
jgi:hypothetical protein